MEKGYMSELKAVLSTDSSVIINGNISDGSIVFPENSGDTDLVYLVGYSDDKGSLSNTYELTVSSGVECSNKPSPDDICLVVKSNVIGAIIDITAHESSIALSSKNIGEDGSVIFTKDELLSIIDVGGVIRIRYVGGLYRFDSNSVEFNCGDEVTINGQRLYEFGLICKWKFINQVDSNFGIRFSLPYDIYDSSGEVIDDGVFKLDNSSRYLGIHFEGENWNGSNVTDYSITNEMMNAADCSKCADSEESSYGWHVVTKVINGSTSTDGIVRITENDFNKINENMLIPVVSGDESYGENFITVDYDDGQSIPGYNPITYANICGKIDIMDGDEYRRRYIILYIEFNCSDRS